MGGLRPPLVHPEWLAAHLNDPGIRIVDCRADLWDPAAARRAYAAGHIPGAVYADLDADLSGPKLQGAGRHPLPDPQAFAQCLGRWGVDPEVWVIAYDGASGGLAAARLWWLLRYLGHRGGASVLDGGFVAWVRLGLPITREAAVPKPRRFRPHLQPHLVAGPEEVWAASRAGRLVDVRAPERFRGEVEPIDPRPGRIPGAVNRPWHQCLTPEGWFCDPPRQRQRFAPFLEGPPPVFYCGSGVTACAGLLALTLAGRPDGRLYPGSYSAWVSDPTRPVEVG